MADHATTGADLSGNPRWKRVTETWTEAEEVVTGKRGTYLFDEAGQTALLDRIASAHADVEALTNAGVLDKAEGELLRNGLTALDERARDLPAEEERHVMVLCYEMTSYYENNAAFKRLQSQVSLLETLAASETLRKDVVGRALDGIKRDLKHARGWFWRRSLEPEERAEAKRVRESVHESLKRIRERMQS